MRVLLIEDDSAVARSIELMLKSAGFNIYTTDLGEEGVDLGKVYEYDMIILDLSLPDISGYEVLKQLRMGRVNTPVMILSGNPDIEAKVKTLGYGADDYLTKPFNKDELIARITAIVRRSKGHAESVIRTGEIVVNLDAKTVDVEGEPVHLTPIEFKLLYTLMSKPGMALSRTELFQEVWGYDFIGATNLVEVTVRRLREKVEAEPSNPDHILTVRGAGYKFRTP